jgi:hypothetical protein
MAEVTYYGADWCVDCRRSKAFMLKHNVEFVQGWRVSRGAFGCCLAGSARRTWADLGH